MSRPEVGYCINNLFSSISQYKLLVGETAGLLPVPLLLLSLFPLAVFRIFLFTIVSFDFLDMKFFYHL